MDLHGAEDFEEDASLKQDSLSATRLQLAVAHTEMAPSDLAQLSIQLWKCMFAEGMFLHQTHCIFTEFKLISSAIHKWLTPPPFFFFFEGCGGMQQLKKKGFFPSLCFFRIAYPQDFYSLVTQELYFLVYKFLLSPILL